jgi:hypothetical protein
MLGTGSRVPRASELRRRTRCGPTHIMLQRSITPAAFGIRHVGGLVAVSRGARRGVPSRGRPKSVASLDPGAAPPKLPVASRVAAAWDLRRAAQHSYM